jgi:uncharacterized membrane protein
LNESKREPIRNPVEWTVQQVGAAGQGLREAGTQLGTGEEVRTGPPVVRRIAVRDLGDVLARGLADFGACRTDVLFLCIVYPVAGLVLARLALGYDLLPLLFPLVSGFALLGPIAAVGLYEMSRRRERQERISWADAFGVLGAPTLGTIVALGAILVAAFATWVAVAQLIYVLTLGPEPPASFGGFARDVLTTPEGWTMTAVGLGVGFLFAAAIFSISVVSFPLLLDRRVGLGTAMGTSVRAVRTNPGPMAVWGLLVTALLVLGSLPALLGLIFAMPVLGHATWHLYRRVVQPPLGAAEPDGR